MNFNDKSEKPRFIHKPNPLIQRSYQIFAFQDRKDDYEPVGEYTVIDMDEDPEITDKKMINLLTIMNGKRDLIDFTNLTKERILFNIVTETSGEKDKEKVVFRTYDGQGVSKENAVLTIEKGVFHDRSDQS